MKTHVSNLPELVAEVVMGWQFKDRGGYPCWTTAEEYAKPYSWNPARNSKDNEEMLDTLGTWAVSNEEEGCYFTVYKEGEAYEGFHESRKIASCIAALKAGGMDVELEDGVRIACSQCKETEGG